ncbi:MAG: hypothetical protein ABIH23_16610, partial [bacterium]
MMTDKELDQAVELALGPTEAEQKPIAEVKPTPLAPPQPGEEPLPDKLEAAIRAVLPDTPSQNPVPPKADEGQRRIQEEGLVITEPSGPVSTAVGRTVAGVKRIPGQLGAMFQQGVKEPLYETGFAGSLAADIFGSVIDYLPRQVRGIEDKEQLAAKTIDVLYPVLRKTAMQIPVVGGLYEKYPEAI